MRIQNGRLFQFLSSGEPLIIMRKKTRKKSKEGGNMKHVKRTKCDVELLSHVYS